MIGIAHALRAIRASQAKHTATVYGLGLLAGFLVALLLHWVLR